jgi:Family of unknown function (DUF6266)
MARLINGIFGPVSGKVGDVIFSSWRGIHYVKARNKKHTKKGTAKQKAHRIKFAKAQEWLSPLLEFVRIGFNGYRPPVRGFAAATSYLLKNAVEGEAPDFYINPSKMMVSYGNLPLSKNLAVEKLADSRIQFSWNTRCIEGASPSDQVMLLAYNIEGNTSVYLTTGRFRRDGVDELKLPSGTGTWHLYMAFTADDRKQLSHSVYMGEIQV